MKPQSWGCSQAPPSSPTPELSPTCCRRTSQQDLAQASSSRRIRHRRGNTHCFEVKPSPHVSVSLPPLETPWQPWESKPRSCLRPWWLRALPLLPVSSLLLPPPGPSEGQRGCRASSHHVPAAMGMTWSSNSLERARQDSPSPELAVPGHDPLAPKGKSHPLLGRKQPASVFWRVILWGRVLGLFGVFSDQL